MPGFLNTLFVLFAASATLALGEVSRAIGDTAPNPSIRIETAEGTATTKQETAPTDGSQEPASRNQPTKDSSSPGPKGSVRQIPALRPTEKSRLALVIGNSRYVNVPFLKNPVTDAHLITQSLIEANFTVIEGTDLDHASMNEIFRDFAGRIGTSEAALFYYSGHGFEVNGQNYLLPVDAAIAKADDVADQGISMSALLEVIEAAETRIIVLDACRDDPFKSSISRTRSIEGGSTRAVSRGLARMNLDRSGSFLAYSTSPGGLALDGDGNNSPFASALAETLALPGLEIEQVFRIVRRAVYLRTQGAQRPWVTSSLLESFYFLPPSGGMVKETDDRIAYSASDSVVKTLGSGSIVANGDIVGEVKDGSISPAAFWNTLKTGINILQGANGNRVRTWLESRRLELLSDPYRRSYAVIAAIDQYDGPNDAGGYRSLGFMVDGAKKIRDRLTRLGFPKENIVELYNEAATRENIENALGDFWEGGSAEKADRVVFYFGGHGDKYLGTTVDDEPIQRGVLITHGFDKKRAARSGLLLDDITGRQFRYTSARQFLVLIDACSSGLALPRFQEDEKVAESKVQRLATINMEASKRSQAILVAGTGEEKALWVNGGVFTSSLVRALDGAADWNKDGLIMFEELSLQVRWDVKNRASQEAGVAQVPASFSTGPGKFLFVLP